MCHIVDDVVGTHHIEVLRWNICHQGDRTWCHKRNYERILWSGIDYDWNTDAREYIAGCLWYVISPLRQNIIEVMTWMSNYICRKGGIFIRAIWTPLKLWHGWVITSAERVAFLFGRLECTNHGACMDTISIKIIQCWIDWRKQTLFGNNPY